MNGHVLTILAPVLAVVVRRVPLPRDWSRMSVFTRKTINQSRIDAQEVDPNFVNGNFDLFP